MKKTLLVVSVLALCVLLVISVYAHPGRTDGAGGHTDRSTGEYHYHHGYSAHQHYDMNDDGIADCPYNFKDKTNHSSGNNTTKKDSVSDDRTDHSSGISNSISDTTKEDSVPKKTTIGDVLLAMLKCLPSAIVIGCTASYLLFHLFYLIWGEQKGCSISLVSFVVISVIAYIWLIFIALS